MTAPERLSAHPVAFHPSRRRASARNSEVRLNSDAGPHRRASEDPQQACRSLCNRRPRSSEPFFPALTMRYRPSATH